MNLRTFPADANQDDILDVLARDGACIVADLASPANVQRMREELTPLVESTPFGGDSFVGRKTQRTGALVARTPSCRSYVLSPTVIDTARAFLSPWAEKIQLHITQTICIHPGEGAQVLHRDCLAWGNALPVTIEPQLNTIWALTDFTKENGATRVVPGSHKWPREQKATPEMIAQAEMSAGSVLLYTGTVLHSGGENSSDSPRIGLNIGYCLGWLRQEENQYLSCPPHVARYLEPELQELLGYTKGNYALGYYSNPDASLIDGCEILPPEHAVGRWPRTGQDFSYTSTSNTGELEQI